MRSRGDEPILARRPFTLFFAKDAFVEYLMEDGIYLAATSEALPVRGRPEEFASMDEDAYRPDAWSSSSSEDGGGEGGPLPPSDAPERLLTHGSSDSSSSSSRCSGPAALPWSERFPEVRGRIAAAIAQLGGQVVPKLNWSCPSDATWLNPGATLACGNAEQVVLMLKSSDRIGHDLDHLHTRYNQQRQQQGEALPPPPCPLATVLVLRLWNPSLRPEREFRCFVRAGVLSGACQRDVSQHFPQLAAPSAAVTEAAVAAGKHGAGPTADGDEGGGSMVNGGGSTPLQAIKRAIAGFHHDHVASSAFILQNYTYDLYISSTLAIKVMDFNPVGGSTSPLLFSWRELGYSSGELGQGGGSSRGGREVEAGPGATEGEEEALVGEPGSTAIGISPPLSGSSAGLPPSSAPVAPRWPLRVVARGGGLQAGQRAACAMPYDMLSLGGEGAGQASAAEEVLALMQRTRVQGGSR